MTDSPLFTPVERFLRYLGVERQLSPITLLNYRRQLETLIALADSAGLKSWQQCDAAQVRSLAVRSRRQGLGPASLALRLSALRSFFDWLGGHGGPTSSKQRRLAGEPGRTGRESGEGGFGAENTAPFTEKYRRRRR